MKSNKNHFIITRWTWRISRDVERSLHRIEHENRWLASLINGCIAGAAVALVSWLVTSLQEGDILLFACLGSSAASVVFAPLSKNNSLRTIILAYVIASLVCVLLFPLHREAIVPFPIQCFLAVALPISIMRLTDSMHPAAIGSALSFIFYDRDIRSLTMLLLAILGLLTIVKILAYVYLEDLRFKDFGREFSRKFYGKEVTVTVQEPETETSSVEST